jgi:hypothetical protein
MSSLEDLDDVDRVWVKVLFYFLCHAQIILWFPSVSLVFCPQHDDHVGFLRDGELFCSVQPQSKSIANKKQPILVKHELGIGIV